MQDLSVHFSKGKEYRSMPPDNSPNYFTLCWGGEAWDGGPDQLHLTREDQNEGFTGEKASAALSQAAKEQGFSLKLVLDRTNGECDPTFMFFDLEGDTTFRPQEFVDRFTELLYAD